MKSIIIGAGRGISDGSVVDYHKTLYKDIIGRRVLDWILNSFKESGITDTVFIGGFQIEKIMEFYPSLRYYTNNSWDTTNILSTLMCASEELNSDVLVSYSDITFRPDIIKSLIASKDDITILIDSKWRNRYVGRTGEDLQKSEKVIVKNGYVSNISKNIPVTSLVSGEFIGLCKIKANVANEIRKIYTTLLGNYQKDKFYDNNSIHQASLIDMFQELINRGYRIKAIDVEGQWAKLNSTKDLSHFIFGTKGETLERLKPLLLSAKICEQVRFEVQEWEDNQSGCIELIQSEFPNVKLVVRSSSLIEDTADHSFAGAFESFFNIDSNNISQLKESIESVIKSYEEVAAGNTSHNQILVQPQLVDVAISGVLFTRDLETASPYYIVNYDDKTSRTNSVTAGTDNLKTLVVFKECIEEVKNEDLKKLLKVTKEIEMIIGNETIDIEFAITRKGEIYIFQVRPIAALKGKSIVSIDDFIIWLSKTQRFIRCLDTNKTSDLLGDRTILANMPDWNPAELIGTKPKPLAYSLYEYLITNDVWREARGLIGYHNPTSESLMKSVFGQPYIDIRVSFNTLLPKTISPDLGRQLINYYINYLTEHPELHDKVEFEVIPTCISFDMTKFENNLYEAGFTRLEINELNTELFKLTNNIISGRFTTVSEQLKLVKSLNDKRKYVKTTISSKENIPYLIKVLLDDCKEYGTKPFTILARYAFIAVAFLKSFIQRGIITYSEYTNFLESVETIASKTVNDFAKVMQGEMSRGKFLEIYGHLRPGTYDINSARYDEKPEVYLKPTDLTINNEKNKDSLQLSAEQYIKIQSLIEEFQFDFNVDELFEFIRTSISAREEAKFEFTKNLSDVLSLINDYGSNLGICREDLAFIRVESILGLANKSELINVKNELQRQVTIGREQYGITEFTKLPPIITTEKDLVAFIINEDQPNYITNKSITGEIIVLNGDFHNTNLDNKIVVIECADPGYDWIFTHSIVGLITKYGGANSHMAIRCTEFNIPAAIGCGEVIYTKVVNSKLAELNCGVGYVKVQ